MTIQPGANVYTQGFGSRPENVEVPHIDVRPPGATDTLYPIGKRWVDTTGGSEYCLVSVATINGVVTATWGLLGTTTGALNTLTGDSGGAISPTAGNINIFGTSGEIDTTGSGSTITISLATPVTVPNGGTGDTSFTAYSVVCGGTTSTNPLQNVSGVGIAGQILTSNGAAMLPTWQAAGGGSGVISLAGDSGGPLTGALTLTGGSSGAVFTGSGTTITESFDFLALPNTDGTGNGIIELNSISYFSNFGTNNVFAGPNSGNTTNTGAGNAGLGFNVLNSLTTGNDNIAIGASSLAALTTGSDNTGVGSLALQSNVTGSSNVSIGAGSLGTATAGGSNVAVGASALNGLLTGTNNISVGANSGSNYVGAESSNLLIGNSGVAVDANTIRIGTQGAGTGQQNTCFVAGVAGVSVSNLNTVTIDTVTGQLGSTASAGTPSLSPYIVGTTGVSGFATIQAAINQAIIDGVSVTNPLQIYIKPGLYTENLTLHDGVYLIGIPSQEIEATAQNANALAPAVRVQGTITANYSLGGTRNYIQNISFSTNGITLIAPSPGALYITFESCILNGSSTNLFICTNNPQIQLNNCYCGLIGSANLFSSTDANGCSIFGIGSTFLTNVTTPMSFASAIAIVIKLRDCFWRTSFNITAASGSLDFIATNSSIIGNNSSDMFKSTNVGFASSFELNTSIIGGVFTGFNNLINVAAGAAFFSSCNFKTSPPSGVIISPVYALANCSSSDPVTSPNDNEFFKGKGSGYSASMSTRVQDTVQTTTASTTTIATITVPTNQSIVIEGRVIGQDAGFTDATGGSYMAVAQNNGGVLSLIGTATTVVKASSTGTFSVTTSGTDVLVQVAGLALTTYNWTTFYDYEFIATNA